MEKSCFVEFLFSVAILVMSAAPKHGISLCLWFPLKDCFVNDGAGDRACVPEIISLTHSRPTRLLFHISQLPSLHWLRKKSIQMKMSEVTQI
jgi:hypothetical protein